MTDYLSLDVFTKNIDMELHLDDNIKNAHKNNHFIIIVEQKLY